MSAATLTAAPGTAPKKSKKLLYIIVCVGVCRYGRGDSDVRERPGTLCRRRTKMRRKQTRMRKMPKTVIVPCGDVVVNLSEDRLQRYLRVKLAVLVDAEAEKEVEELMTKKKAAVKSAIIAPGGKVAQRRERVRRSRPDAARAPRTNRGSAVPEREQPLEIRLV